MITMRVHIQGLKEVRAALRKEVKRERFGIARGLTRTAKDVEKTLVAEEIRVFNRPNSYTLRAFRVEPAVAAAAGRVQAAVELRKDPQYSRHPLTPQVLGGNRAVKRFERSLQAKGAMQPGWFAVPTDRALDGNGKVRRGLIQQIIAQAAFQMQKGYGKQLGFKPTKKQARSAIQAQGRAGGQFVFIPRRRGRLAPGIYLAEGRDFGAKIGYGRKGTLIPLFRYVSTVSYKSRLDFFGIAERIVNQNVVRNITSSLLYAD